MGDKRTLFVIIPVYNGIRYLSEAVASVLSQPYRDIRVCIVDDGSVDGTSELCDALAANESRIHVIHKSNAGVSVARNAGINWVLSVANLKLDYLAFCDADDMWVPNAITNDFFSNCYGYDMYICNMLKSTQNMDRFSISTSYKDEDITNTPSIIWEWDSSFVSHLYSCDLINRFQIRFSELTKFAEDIMFDSVCIYLSQKIRRCSRYLYIYRYNSSSAMHTKNRLPPITYFLQIINGWIETDNTINAWSKQTGKTSKIGYTLSSIYFLDMAAEHYRHWGKQKQIEAALQSHPYYFLFINMAEKDVSPTQYRNHLLMKNNPVVFRLKNYLVGIKLFIMECMFKLPLIKAIYFRKKYPLVDMPQNQ